MSTSSGEYEALIQPITIIDIYFGTLLGILIQTYKDVVYINDMWTYTFWVMILTILIIISRWIEYRSMLIIDKKLKREYNIGDFFGDLIYMAYGIFLVSNLKFIRDILFLLFVIGFWFLELIWIITREDPVLGSIKWTIPCYKKYVISISLETLYIVYLIFNCSGLIVTYLLVKYFAIGINWHCPLLFTLLVDVIVSYLGIKKILENLGFV